MHLISSSPAVRRLLAASIVARLPLAMVSVALLVHARQVTGSFAQAGLIAGAYAVGLGVGGPLLGQLVDRRGQTLTLLASASIASATLVTIGLLPAHVSFAAFVTLAVVAGLATPPVGACLRAQLPVLIPDPSAVGGVYALEASLVELTYIFGPPLALCLAAFWSSGGGLAIAGVTLLGAVTVFATHSPSRGGQPVAATGRHPRGSLRTPTMRTLVIILVAVGMLLGVDEVAVIAAATALHSAGGAAPLFAVWGAGSFIGGLLFTRLSRVRLRVGIAPLLAMLTAGHLVLIPADRNGVLLAVALLIAGTTIAPTEATLYAMVDPAAPDGTITEAFAWLATAMAVGSAAGAAGAGLVVDRVGVAAAFALAGVAGALAVLTSTLGSCTGILPPVVPPTLPAPVRTGSVPK
jgi:predicted MFS family arabinose efflux permease